jgi:hypothetical protein
LGFQGYKANTRNMHLLEAHLENPIQAKHDDCCFLSGVFFLVVILPCLLVAGLIAGLVVLIMFLVGAFN